MPTESQYSTYGPPPKSPEQVDRTRRLTERAIKVFGNPTTAGVWSGQFQKHLPGWPRPWDAAEESEEGLHLMLAELDRLAPITVPDYHDPVKAALKARKRRR